MKLIAYLMTILMSSNGLSDIFLFEQSLIPIVKDQSLDVIFGIELSLSLLYKRVQNNR